MSKNENKSRKERREKKKNRKTPWGYIWRIALALIVILAIIVGGVSIYWVATSPELTEADLRETFGSTLVDSEGTEYYTLGSREQVVLEPSDVSENLESAVLAIEDQRFYEHPGVDPIRIAGAAISNLTSDSLQGGSTITQQLVKLSVFSTTDEDQNIKRKVQEAWLALELERNYSKEQILTMYMNKVYMSDNVYGMGTAAEYYYGKTVNELTLPQAALLAGMPQAPNAYNPYDYPEQATERRDTVIYSMLEANFITEAQAEEAYAVPITEGLQERDTTSGSDLVVDAYVKQVLAEIEEKTDIDPYSAGATIYTNIDLDAQQYLYDLLNSDEYINFPDEELQAGVSVLNSQNGQVVALGGGRNSEGRLAYNRATELDRSIGSAMKPITVYGPAIESEQYSTAHILEDSEYAFPTGDELRNYDREYEGDITMRRALVDSRNIPTARLLEDIGLETADQFAKGIGVSLNDGDGLYWSDAIGGIVTPMQLSASYAAFANGGNYTDPYTVSRIVLRDGQEIDLTPETTQAMSDYTAYMITDMLKDASGQYSAINNYLGGIPNAGKTGTTNYTEEQMAENNIPEDNFPDRWYSGYTTNYSISVWTGYDYQFEEGNSLNYNDGTGTLVFDIYGLMMQYMSQDVENNDWQMPESVVEHDVIVGSDPPAIAPANASVQTTSELFVEGNEPEVSTEVQEEETSAETSDLVAPSGLTATYNAEANAVQIQWNAVSGLENPTYGLTINGNTTGVDGTSYTLDNPQPGSTVTISLTTRSGGDESSPTSITVPIPGGEEDEEETTSEEETTTSEEESSSSQEETTTEESSESQQSSSQPSSSQTSETTSQAPEPETSTTSARTGGSQPPESE